MPKIMLINVTHAEESRVGIVTDGVLSSFEIESFSREHLKGNIYRGVINRIHPALEAAFVDIGADRNAFLPLDEICFRNLPNPPPAEPAEPANGRRRGIRIQDILKPGDEVVVQIVKEEFANKPPTLSTFYSLPGRYLVLLPGSDDAGISRRIEGDDRQKIRELIERLQPPAGFGIIVRTAAGLDQNVLDQSFQELQRDLSYLQRLWESIQQTASSKRAPALVYREHDLVLRNIRDYFTPDIDEIYVDNEEVFERARAFLREVMPGKENVLRLYAGDQPIFSQFNVENQIESIYKRRVPLKSGGSVVLDGTEALTAIDVNSGRSTRGTNQEETAFRTNREAALEIARQLRLRDVGGLIVIDFIDMKAAAHIAEVERTLRSAMREDKARHELGRISSFGLLEISRQRLRPAAAASSYSACPMCEGYGLVRTTESAALVGLRKIHNRVAKGDVALLRASFPSDVGVYLLNQKREDVAQLEKRYGTRIHVVLSSELLPHQSELEVRARAESEPAAEPQQRPMRLGGVAQPSEGAAAEERSIAAIAESPAPIETIVGASEPVGAAPAPTASKPEPGVAAAAAANGAEPTGERRRSRRRRGRRRGRGRQPGALNSEATPLVAGAAGPMPQGGERAVQPSREQQRPPQRQHQTPPNHHQDRRPGSPHERRPEARVQGDREQRPAAPIELRAPEPVRTPQPRPLELAAPTPPAAPPAVQAVSKAVKAAAPRTRRARPAPKADVAGAARVRKPAAKAAAPARTRAKKTAAAAKPAPARRSHAKRVSKTRDGSASPA